MNEILISLSNPAVIASVLLTIVLQLIFKYAPGTVKAWIKFSNLKELRKIKSTRHNQDLVIFESMKTHSYYLVFLGTFALFIILVAIGPLQVLINSPRWVTFIVASPIFVFEIMWLWQLAYTKSLIKYRAKLRVTRH